MIVRLRGVLSPPEAVGWLRRRQRQAEEFILDQLGNTPGVWIPAVDLQLLVGLGDRRFYPALGRLTAAGRIEAQWDPSDRQWSKYRLPVTEAEQ